ncbi:MAG: alpha/beta hydrolase [Rhizobiales bacterium 17-65-6]|nr:MAG: alpha/beta hydrolase [Rhizobiales bacterium 12-66-7]OYX74420.1 MAG: alpha/beta hydrolase [Rhizobiales bacterium 32-66-11]OYZ98566.1 MAG: alpha/beta hydrolase [Rhizobiales bacterium 17-65-6]
MNTPIFPAASTEFVTIDGLEIRIARSGGSGLPILITAPWPQSIYAFHAIWPTLTTLGPVVAVDLPGFGRSERRAELMAPEPMGGFVTRLADALGIERWHAIGPDVGASAMLFAAAARPSLFESLVVGSGGADMELVGKGLRGVMEAREGEYGEPEGGAQVVSTITRLTRQTPPAEAMEDFRLSSQGRRWIEAADYVRAYPRDLPRLKVLLPAIRTPVLVISGQDDPIVPPANGAFLARHLPRAVHIILDAGHFVWEDDAAGYMQAISAWVKGGYRQV